MDNFVNAGETLEITAGGAISAGDIVVQGDVLGVAFEDIANTEKGNLAISGVYRLPKNTSTAIANGEYVDYDLSADEVTTGITPASGDVVDFGIAMEVGETSDPRINVRLLTGHGVVEP